MENSSHITSHCFRVDDLTPPLPQHCQD